VPKAEIEKRVMEALEMVELSHLRDRNPSNMSGGQQQRIALARAIVIRPQLLLMDEPLSNLDAKLRVKMRSDIRQLQKELNITTIYVTHDQEEALAVSDRIAVMDQGVVQQIATPDEIYSYPSNKFVANFIGESNFLKCRVSGDAAAATVQLHGVEFRLPLVRNFEGEALLSVRPEKIRISPVRSDDARLAGTIVDRTYLGEKVSYLVRIGDGTTLDVRQHAAEPDQLLQIKQNVFLDLQPAKAVLFDGSGKEVIYNAKLGKGKLDPKA
jgi:iron(III) transport system ATP-binding protein